MFLSFIHSMLEKCLFNTSPVLDTVLSTGDSRKSPGYEEFKGRRDRSKQIIGT